MDNDLNLSRTLNVKAGSFKFLESLNLSSEVTRRLSLHLKRIELGSNDVYLTPLGKDNDPDSLLADVDNLLSNSSKSFTDNLKSLESQNRDKFGPRSISKPWSERKPSLEDYFSHQDDDFNNHLSLPNIKFNLRPLSASVAVKYLKNSTNSGLPYYCKKAKIKDSLVKDFDYLSSREDSCVLFTRTQEGNKTRNVWGYPAIDTLKEMMYYIPVLNYQKKLKWRSALSGPHKVDVSISEMMRNRTNESSFVSIDFSAFDASVGRNLQRKSFNYIENLFQQSDLSELFHRFNTIGIVTPSGNIVGSHGVPSGATFTNEVDSIAQYLCSLKSGYDMLEVQGDDGAYLIRNSNIDKLMYDFDKSGLKVNHDKSKIADDCVLYLQRLYDRKYSNNGFIGGIYSIYRALNRLVYQERYNEFQDFGLDGRDYYSIRSISILENCKYHPAFKDFVKYIYNKDKYKLKYSESSVLKYSHFTKDAVGSSGLINQFSDDISGLSSFETVKLIRELA